VCVCLVSKNLTAGHEVQCMVPSLMHLIYYANQWEHFLKHAITGNTTGIVQDPIHPPPLPKNHDKETPITFSSKEIQSHAIGKETYYNCFLENMQVCLGPYYQPDL